MGGTLATQVYTYWKHLPDRPHRLLVHMALTCKDADRPPRYWGGRDALCSALGLPEGEATSYRMVSRAISQLIDEGAIERDVTGGGWDKRSEYVLTVGYRPGKDDPQVIPLVPQPKPPRSARVANARNSDLAAARERIG